MKPGYQWDELIHTKVMGWKKTTRDVLGIVLWESESGHVFTANGPLAYSTDPAAALHAVAKVFPVVEGQRSGFLALMQCADGWQIAFANEDGEVMPYVAGGKVILGKAKTLPEAICLALMKIRGVKVPA